jgi:hypothetical protein
MPPKPTRRLGSARTRNYFESEYPMSYKHGTVAVTTTATPITTISQISENSGVLVQASADTYFGGSTVTTSGATAGIKVSAGSTVLIPTTCSQTLYAITASTSNVTFLHP